MVVVKTIVSFIDLQEDITREVNKEFEVTRKRADELASKGLVKIVDDTEDKQVEIKKEETKKNGNRTSKAKRNKTVQK